MWGANKWTDGMFKKYWWIINKLKAKKEQSFLIALIVARSIFKLESPSYK